MTTITDAINALCSEARQALGDVVEEARVLERGLLNIGWRYSHLIAGGDICEHRSCFKCKLADVLFELESRVRGAATVEPITQVQQVIDTVTAGMSTEDYLGLLEELREVIDERIAIANGQLDGSESVQKQDNKQ